VKTRVLDSSAILEWMSGRQPACDRVGRLLSEAEESRTRLPMSAINVGEVYPDLLTLRQPMWRRHSACRVETHLDTLSRS
jgi:hypothetical protein